jgi:hypothetical protein
MQFQGSQMHDLAGAKPESFSELLDLLSKLRLHEVPSGPPPRASILADQGALHPSPTLTVAPKGADFSSVQEAVRAARSGARILVRPGRYEEGIVLERDVEICGDGPREEIIIESPDFHCLAVQSGRALVKGISLRSLGGRKGNKRFALEVSQGQAIMEDCDISSDTLAGVSVHGPRA